MKLIRLALPVLALACSAAGVAAGDYQPGAKDVARTARPFAGADSLRFVVIGDRTGQHRPGIFEKALAQVDRLHPDFVINIGDLIEGNTEDRAQIEAEWKEVNGAIDQLHTPFFYVPGNHDLTNDVQQQIWRAKLGADYYHFRYKGALFIILNTEDPPQPKIARKKLLEAYGVKAMGKVMGALQGDAALAEALFAREPELGKLATKLPASESVAISTTQIEMVRKALADNPRPRWTFVLMHRPAWKVASPAFERIEAMLKGRPYTMLAGHFHKYAYERRKEQDYIQLGVTGGMPGAKADDPAAQDHIMWVSLADGAPQISNIRLDGFFDKQGPSPK
ncbi:metallophosphoesterase [Sphingomonadales bacterium 56]|uniref:metallophosphoesterase family protein n=1 Tax=Sphingobium sp. S6 TaxID=2758386 RepID=UPI00191B1EAA|nr:metallophosphoesterase [Sphingobium sp. S6]MBY2929840.1 metallophosphoesterase [Sphingomonadales bacterium 56]CAD7340188.1 3',5'-cyclic adenosine monophosphate phosphodiesterase CpdA [Sphingobium sp. S6]